VTLGIDVGKFDLCGFVAGLMGGFERPWRVKNRGDSDVSDLVGRSRRVRKLVVALEPSEPMERPYDSAGGQRDRRPAASVPRRPMIMRRSSTACLATRRQGCRVVAELAALGKAKPWAYQAADSRGGGTGLG
jgi:hypothetical protein